MKMTFIYLRFIYSSLCLNERVVLSMLKYTVLDAIKKKFSLVNMKNIKSLLYF